MSTYWALEWRHHLDKPGYIDPLTIATLRSGSWALLDARLQHASPAYLAKIKRNRRKGEIRAIKIRIERVGP